MMRRIVTLPGYYMRNRFTHLGLIVLLTAWPGMGFGQTADKIDAAKKEGQLVFFSVMIVQDTQALLWAFEKRFPFIRSDSLSCARSALVARIQTEKRAGVQSWDVYNSTGFEGYVCRARIFGPLYSPERKNYPEGIGTVTVSGRDLHDPDVAELQHASGIAQRFTEGIQRFSSPRWKGKLGLDPQDFQWYANLRKFGAANGRASSFRSVPSGRILRQGERC